MKILWIAKRLMLNGKSFYWTQRFQKLWRLTHLHKALWIVAERISFFLGTLKMMRLVDNTFLFWFLLLKSATKIWFLNCCLYESCKLRIFRWSLGLVWLINGSIIRLFEKLSSFECRRPEAGRFQVFGIVVKLCLRLNYWYLAAKEAFLFLLARCFNQLLNQILIRNSLWNQLSRCFSLWNLIHILLKTAKKLLILLKTINTTKKHNLFHKESQKMHHQGQFRLYHSIIS